MKSMRKTYKTKKMRTGNRSLIQRLQTRLQRKIMILNQSLDNYAKTFFSLIEIFSILPFCKKCRAGILKKISALLPLNLMIQSKRNNQLQVIQRLLTAKKSSVIQT